MALNSLANYVKDNAKGTGGSKKKKEEELIGTPITNQTDAVRVTSTAPITSTDAKIVPTTTGVAVGANSINNKIEPAKTTGIAYPTYTSPTAGASFSYGTSMPTWSWDKETPGEFNWDKEAPTYTSAYQDQINAMVDQILNRPAFSYDYNQDPLYAQYADAYTRNGNQAMNDTLAQVSARTGGLASSYAGTAAQQTYNRYMDALNDKIPELYQLAYSMYNDEGNNMRNNLNMIQGLENTDYGRYMDSLGQWNTDRSFAYNQYADLWDRYYNDRNFDYGVYQDALGQWNTNRNFEYNKWSDDLARQEAAAKAAYNAQVAAYNAANGSSNGAAGRSEALPYYSITPSYQTPQQTETKKASGGSSGTKNDLSVIYSGGNTLSLKGPDGMAYNLSSGSRENLQPILNSIASMDISASEKQALADKLVSIVDDYFK